MPCRDQVVVITGASMGIGEAVARAFVDQDAFVVMSSRDLGRVEQARARVGRLDRTVAIACDVADPQQIHALVSAAKERFGKIDVWINNAGYGLTASVATMSMNECRRIFETNVFGAIECMQAVAPVMTAQGRGAIINISSVVGHLPLPYMGAYSATKHALNAFSEAARLELEPAGVRVISVCPGRIKTNFSQNAVREDGKRIPGPQGISPERCARAVVNAYLRGSREVFVPWHGWWISHLYELWPQVVEFGMRRMLKRG
jgi:short-subunit dehydrogenase